MFAFVARDMACGQPVPELRLQAEDGTFRSIALRPFQHGPLRKPSSPCAGGSKQRK